MKTILVTGGAGFIGSHTVDLLLSKGYRVVVYDNFTSGKLANLAWSHAQLRVVQADVMDYLALIKEIKVCDAVLHLAALPSVPKSIEDPIGSLKVNLLGMLHVLQAIREVNKNIRFVYASSAAVYGEGKVLPCSDEHALHADALSPYALEKATNEEYAALFSRLFNIKSIGLRYFNVFGPRQDPSSIYSGVISTFIARYRNQEVLTIYGDGLQSRDFIHVTDVAHANCLALESLFDGVLNIATGQPQTLLDLIRCIEEAGHYPAKIDFVPARAGDIRESYATVDHAKKMISFSSVVSLLDGIKEMV